MTALYLVLLGIIAIQTKAIYDLKKSISNEEHWTEIWKDNYFREKGEVIRCRDCKYKSVYDGETKYYYCALEDRPNRNWSVDDWNFCYWGERKENE